MSKDEEKHGSKNGQPSHVRKRDEGGKANKREGGVGNARKGYQPTARTEGRVGEPTPPPKKP